MAAPLAFLTERAADLPPVRWEWVSHRLSTAQDQGLTWLLTHPRRGVYNLLVQVRVEGLWFPLHITSVTSAKAAKAITIPSIDVAAAVAFADSLLTKEG